MSNYPTTPGSAISVGSAAHSPSEGNSVARASLAEHSRWFAEEVRPHEPLLRNYLRSTFRDIQDMDDVVQESYLRLWKARAAQEINSTKAFLFTVARRFAINVLRKRGNAPFVTGSDQSCLAVVDDRPNAAEAACEQEKVDLLADAVMALPARCREIIVLHKIQGLPQREVGARLGISDRTVERQTRIGVQRCLTFLRRHGMEGFYDE